MGKKSVAKRTTAKAKVGDVHNLLGMKDQTKNRKKKNKGMEYL